MSVFKFKYFSIEQSRSAMKVGTDALVLAASIPRDETVQRILEIGSGTGVISLILAQRFEQATVAALEIDEASADESSFNFLQSPWSDRLHVYHADFFRYRTEKKFDLIVSNPPYYSTQNASVDERVSQSKHITNTEISEFAVKTASLLGEQGRAVIIFPYSSQTIWFEAFQVADMYPLRIIEVQGKADERPVRVIAFFGFQRTDALKETFVVRKKDGNYSDEYKVLTQDLHDRELP